MTTTATARSRWPNADPRWPALIVELAARVAEGEDCRYALHDVWLECGFPPTPISVSTFTLCRPGTKADGNPKSVAVGLILGVYPPFPGERKWLARCLEGRQP